MRGYNKRRGLKYRGNNMRYPKSQIASRMLAVMNCIEKKYVDVGPTTYTPNTGGAITTRLFSPIEDADIQTDPTGKKPHEVRVGNQIFVSSIQFKFDIWNNDTYAAASQINRGGIEGRIIVAWDHQPNGANPTAIAGSLLVSETVDSFYALETIGRYKVIWNKRFMLRPSNYALATAQTTAPAGGTASWTARQSFSKFIPLKNQRITYNGATGAVSELSNKNLVVFFLQDGQTNYVNFQVSYRLKFTD